MDDWGQLPYQGSWQRLALDLGTRAVMPVVQSALKSAAGYGTRSYAPVRTRPRYVGPGRMDYSRDRMGLSKYRRPHQKNTGYFGGGDREAKFHDNDQEFGVGQTGSVVASVNLLTQGITECDRIGQRIIVKKLEMKFAYLFQNAANDTADIIRIIVFIDKQCNGATATVLNLLETEFYNSHLNLSNMDRFRILYDRTLTLNLQANQDILNGCQAGATRTFTTQMKLPVEYKNGTDTIGAVTSNNIGYLTISKLASKTTLRIDTRIRYVG